MPGLGGLTTTLITTKGLFTLGDVPGPGFTILTFGAGITPFFRLYISGAPPPPPVQYVAAGGSRVYQPGEYADSWKYVDPTTGQTSSEPWLVVPREHEGQYFNKGKIITIKLVWGDKQLERQYSINERVAKRVIEATNFVNTTKERMKITASTIKKVTTTAIVEARNLVLRRKPNK